MKIWFKPNMKNGEKDQKCFSGALLPVQVGGVPLPFGEGTDTPPPSRFNAHPLEGTHFLHHGRH